MALPAGTCFGPYEILATLGAGGMGEVYKARDARLERDVAVKVLPPHLTDSPQARERFQREARAVAALQHPNICTIYDVGETADGQAYLVMELLHGETLQERLHRGPLDVAAVSGIGTALADALELAHGAGLVHRDIKPANIILTRRGLKIVDFGLAKSVQTPAAAAPLDATKASPLVTDPGSAVGTVAYMSPEQLRGDDLDARTDLFSVGLVLYETATGRPAFTGPTSAVIGAAILHESPPAPRACRPDLPERLESIILKAIEKDRALRYQHASELRTDLRRLMRDSDTDRASVRHAPGVSVSRLWKIAFPALAVALLGAAGYFKYFNSPITAKLTDKDTIVLADFTNTTGDAVFDETLRQGLSVQLGQSPFLSLVPDERIQKTKRLMGQPADAPLTPALAKEICERTASAAVLHGSIASLGSQYVLGLRATNCRTGDVLDEEQVQAAKKEEVLDALSRIAGSFRRRIGESLATIDKHERPLEDATTTSLDALKAYSAAMKTMEAQDFPSALPFFKRAIEIDPRFAMAYTQMGFTYGLIGQQVLAAQNNRKAYELRDRVSDRERFQITANYDVLVTGNLEDALQTVEMWVRTFPRDFQPYGLLGAFLYPTFGEFAKGADAARKLIALNPDLAFAYLQLGFNSQFSGRLTDADEAFRQAAERKLEIPEIAVQRFDIDFLKGDQGAMEREVALAQGKPGFDDLMTARLGFVLGHSGHMQQARMKLQRATDLALQTEQRGRAALWATDAALFEAFFGNQPAAIQNASKALGLSTDRDVEYGAAFALALAGDSAKSDALAIDLRKRFPEDSSVRFGYLPTIRALLALNHGEAAPAIESLKAGARYDQGVPLCAAPGYFGILYPVYVRGLAYLAARQGTEAAAEFQKILDRRVVVVSDPIGALARLQLARAIAVSGETRRAKTAYQDFLTLWKDADVDLPVLVQAKAELAALH